MKGHIKQRGKNSWSVIIELGRDAKGKRTQKWHTVHGGKRDAERELAKLINAFNSGIYVEPTKLTVSIYLERWLKDYAKSHVSTRTYEWYSELVNKHFIPKLGSINLLKLQPMQIQSYYTAAMESGRSDKKGGLSAKTVLAHHRVLREALQQAVRWQLAVRNPADAVEPPIPRPPIHTLLDDKQTGTLLEKARETNIHVAVVLAVSTGMRRGEILAVRWRNIDLEAGRLTVEQSLEESKEGVQFKEPKSRSSRRPVALPKLALVALKSHRATQAAQKLKLGPVYEDNDLVIAMPDGRPWRPSHFTATFKRLVRSSGLPDIRFHDLRHGHATMLLRKGVHAKVVSERLGHSQIGITMDLYSHVTSDLQEEAAHKLDEVFSGETGKKRD